MIIAVGSENKVKLEAVKRGFENAGYTDITIIGKNVPSGIPEQPFGHEETLTGARNRARNTLTHFPDADLIIGIESGVMEDNCDAAIIYCLIKDEDYEIEHYALSEKVKFPNECIDEARKRGFDTVTVGQIMQELGIVKDQKDPHLSLTGKSRTDYLTNTITQLVDDILRATPSPRF